MEIVRGLLALTLKANQALLLIGVFSGRMTPRYAFAPSDWQSFKRALAKRVSKTVPSLKRHCLRTGGTTFVAGVVPSCASVSVGASVAGAATRTALQEKTRRGASKTRGRR